MKIYIPQDIIKESLEKTNNINDNFKKWFGSSKITKNGEPLIVYKGMLKRDWRTGQTINVIKSTTGSWAGYFTDKKSVAKGFRDIYGTMGEADVYEVFLKIESPYVVDAKNEPAKNFMLDADVIEKQGNEELKKVLGDKKYDGIIIKNTSDEGTLYIPFSSNQIKSIHNDGSFDESDDNIYS